MPSDYLPIRRGIFEIVAHAMASLPYQPNPLFREIRLRQRRIIAEHRRHLDNFYKQNKLINVSSGAISKFAKCRTHFQ